MKYHTIMFAAAVVCGGPACADGTGSVTKDEMADYHVECLETAFGDELTGEQKDQFVKECVQKKVAARNKASDKKS